MPRVLKLAIFFASGALLVHQQIELVSGLLILAIAGFLLPFARWKVPQYLISGCIGLAWSNTFSGFILDSAPPVELLGQPIVVTGKIKGLPYVDSAYTRFDLHLKTAESGSRIERLNTLVRLRWYGNPLDIIPGQRWQFIVKLKAPRGYRNPGLFDYELYLFRNRIRATGYVLKDRPASLLSDSTGYSVDRIRYSLAQKLEQAITNRPSAGIIGALAIGDRSAISQQQWAFFRQTGLSHLMAISGLHIGLAALFGYTLAAGLWRMSGLLSRRVPAKQAAAVTGFLIALVYSALAGFPLPTTRALTMLLVYTLGVILLKRYPPEACLGIAVFVIVCINPLDTGSPGFWLSFIAVWVIFRAHKIWHHFQKPKSPVSAHKSRRFSRVLRGIRSLALVQMSLFLGLFPIQALFFSEVSLVAPLCNFLVVPIFAFIVVPPVLFGVATIFLGGVNFGGSTLLVVGWIIENVLALVRPLAEWEFSTLAVSSAVTMTLLVLIAAAACLIWRRFRIFSLPLLALGGATLVWPGDDVDIGGVRLQVLDVGQGLSIFVQTSDHLLLYDTGPRYGEFSLGEAVVLPTMYRNGHDRIDLAVISHFANDHSGGLASLKESVPIRQIIAGEPSAISGSEPCVRGMGFNWDGVEFSVLWPPERFVYTGNNQSCVVRIKGVGGTVLLTGDIEGLAERALIQTAGETLESDILLVPHHGSITSSSEAFIESVLPKIAIVSRGSTNRYAHPHPEVYQRYADRKIRWLDTGHMGQITLNVAPDEIRLSSWKDQRRRFWHS